MAHSFEYAVIRVIPDARRGECVNVGLVIFGPGEVDVRMLPSFAKVFALNAQINLDQLKALPEKIRTWTADITDSRARHALLQNLPLVTVTDLGYFEIGQLHQYEQRVSRLMKTLVTPVAGRPRAQASMRIKTELRRRFIASKILGASTNDITKQLVVEDYPIDETEGLYADFVLKNGSWHVTETADLRATSASNVGRLERASLAAIKLDKAKEAFGKNTKRFVIYASRQDMPTQPLSLLGDYADHIFNLDSRQDMVSYIEIIARAAGSRLVTARN